MTTFADSGFGTFHPAVQVVIVLAITALAALFLLGYFGFFDKE